MSDKKTPEEHRKKLARAKINNALRDGRLKKAHKCRYCDRTTNLQFHHTDYRKPTAGYYICPSCHQKKFTSKGKK